MNDIKIYRLILGCMFCGPSEWIDLVEINLLKVYASDDIPDYNMRQLLNEGETEVIKDGRKFWFVEYDRDYWLVECDENDDPNDIFYDRVDSGDFVDLN